MKLWKLLLFFTILFAVSTSIFAQPDLNRVSRFSLGFSGGLTGDALDLSSEVSILGWPQSSSVHLGYLGNVSAAYAFGKHWQLKLAGELQRKYIEFRIQGYNSYRINLTKATMFVVPVTVAYIFGTKKLLPFISMGMAGEFAINQNSDGTIYYSNGTTEPVSAEDLLRKNNVAVIASAGVYYRVVNKISLSLSPLFSYSILGDAAKSHRYTFGAGAGVLYDL